MAIQTSAPKGQLVAIQSATTTGNGTVLAIPTDITNHIFYITASNATVSAGKVFCETSDDPAFGGTWAAIGSEQTLIQNTKLTVTFQGALAFVRARVSTNVTGGATVSVNYYGNQR